MADSVQDVDRPDVNGTPPKMQAIAYQIGQAVERMTPCIKVKTSDNICSSVSIRGTIDPKSDWANGIFENGLYFNISVGPEKGKRYYEEGDKLTLELYSASYKLKKSKLRKYTGPLEKVIAKLVAWINSNQLTEADFILAKIKHLLPEQVKSCFADGELKSLAASEKRSPNNHQLNLWQLATDIATGDKPWPEMLNK